MSELTIEEKAKRYNRMVEGGRKGGKAKKHFTPESKERQREGARKGGMAKKHFTPESKARQIAGARKGGKRSHIHDVYI